MIGQKGVVDYSNKLILLIIIWSHRLKIKYIFFKLSYSINLSKGNTSYAVSQFSKCYDLRSFIKKVV